MSEELAVPLPHPCRVPGCQSLVGTQRPLCAVCWRLADEPARRGVWLGWRRGRAAHEAAVAAVVAQVGREMRGRSYIDGRWCSRREAPGDTRVSLAAAE